MAHGVSKCEKMFSFKNLMTTLLSLVFLGGFYPLGHIVHNNQDVLVPNELETGHIKLMSQTLKSFISRIGLRGIIFRFEILPTIWHLGHILQNS